MGESMELPGLDAPVAGGPVDVCPLLRAADARGALTDPIDRVDSRNRCAAGAIPALVGPVVQGETCLVAAHARCPRFLAAARLAAETEQAAAAAAAAAEAASRRPARVPRGARTVTPAVVAAAAFAVVCGIASMGFVAARGGLVLELPSPSPVAVASAEPTEPATPAPTPEPTPAPTPTVAASAEPTPSPEPTATAAPSVPADPLLALPGCPDHPGCYLYVVRRGDTLSRIADRFGVPMYLIREFNPQVPAANDAVRLGDTLRLGRSRYVVLDRCADTAGCWLYLVKSGDTLSGISQRYAVPLDALIADNPIVKNGLIAGQTLRLIPPEPPF